MSSRSPSKLPVIQSPSKDHSPADGASGARHALTVTADTHLSDDELRELPAGVRAALKRIDEQPVTQCVFGYARYSDKAQRQSSIERQVEVIHDYAKRANLKIAKVFIDSARTGVNLERDGMQELLAACQANPNSIVVIENLDRLIRSNEAFYEFKLELQECGVVIHDPTGEMPEVLQMVNAAFASHDRRKMLDRMRAGRIQQAEAGRWMWPIVPFGYKRVGVGELQPDDETAPIVRDIFEMRAAGLSYGRIAAELEARLIVAPRGGRRWKHNSLRRILENPIYHGYYIAVLKAPLGAL